VASTAGGSFDAAAFEAERLRLDAAARDGIATAAAAAEAEADLLDHASWI
jgi:5-formyltetrahydrofolate cyclo-ligase